MRAETPSATARLIAAATLLLDASPATRREVAPGAADWCRVLLDGSWRDRLLAASATFAPTRMLWRWLERATLPGIVSHYWHRKRHIESACRDALAGGITRVVIVGAGYDTLALRLAAEFPEVEFLEADHPATQRAKRAALGRAAHTQGLPPNLGFVSCDLAHAALPESCFAGDRATLLIAEGVLMYLPPDGVARHLADWRARLAPGSRVMFSFMHRWPDGRSGFRPYSRWIDAWLATRGEPFQWAIAPEHLAAFVAAAGWSLMRRVGTRALSPTAAHGPIDGESIAWCVAARGWVAAAANVRRAAVGVPVPVKPPASASPPPAATPAHPHHPHPSPSAASMSGR
ncbi:MAG: class I SAM-dependent methyltransferase [Betaproteobacteria bacterium]|nr:class I SAM-dependent methyltransferase [Betaproteobacteria bacterium]